MPVVGGQRKWPEAGGGGGAQERPKRMGVRKKEREACSWGGGSSFHFPDISGDGIRSCVGQIKLGPAKVTAQMHHSISPYPNYTRQLTVNHGEAPASW